MRRGRMIASAMLCLLLAGASVAAADRGHGRGDDKGGGKARSEEKSKERKQRTVRREGERDGRWSDRRAVGTRGDLGRVVRERTAPRYRRMDERVVTRTSTPSGWYNHALRGRSQYSAWDGYRADRWRVERRSWHQRGGYDGYRLPDRRYRLVFGPSHHFRVARCPLVIVGGYPRFYYGGYWITLIDPWPEYWDDYWFQQDDCYVLYDDGGYYLTNVRHPGVRIAVSFTLG